MPGGKKPGKLKTQQPASTEDSASRTLASAETGMEWVREAMERVLHRSTAIRNEINNVAKAAILEAARKDTQQSLFAPGPFGGGFDSSPEEESESR